MFKLTVNTLAAAAVAMICTGAAQAETKILVGLTAGGGYDFAARLMAPFLEKHLGDGETVIVQNVPGASSLNLARQMQVSEADDEIGLVLASQIVKARLDPETVAVDFSSFNWVGSLNSATSVCITSKASGIDTLDKMVTADAKIGATSKAGAFYELAAIIKGAFDAKYEIITGFKGLTDIEAAIERGEIDGYCGTQLDRYVRNNQQETHFVIGSLGKDVEVDGTTIPSFMSQAKTEEDKAAIALYATSDRVYYPFLMAPGASDEAVKKYQDAFAAVIEDPEFLEEAASYYSSIDAMNGPALAEQIQAVADADASTVEHLTDMLQ